MSPLPLAHSGHWLINVLYIVPLVVIIGMLAFSSVKDRRDAAAESAAAAAAADEPDEHSAP